MSDGATLDVRLHGEAVGLLTRGPDSLSFQYGAEWLARDDARPLSCSLPLRAAPYDERACLPFFSNLLPDGDERSALARALGRSEGNTFQLLAEVGGDCGGAVSLHEAPGGRPARPARRAEALDLGAIAALFASLDERPLLAGSGVRMSLAGAQPKLPVVRIGAEWSLPSDTTPSTHILKPEPRRFPGLALNEHACLVLAGRCGLEVPGSRLLAADRPFLEVERYDRKVQDGVVSRLHQEDACQALGFLPDRKYESDGGPRFAQCVEMVREHGTRPAEDVIRLVRWLAFNVVVGNADAHAKNVSLLHEPATRLAPHYDLVATIAFPGLSRELAMRIGGEKLWDRVGRKQWARLSRDIGVSERLVLDEARGMAERVNDHVTDTFGSLGAERLAASVRKRCAHVLDRSVERQS